MKTTMRVLLACALLASAAGAARAQSARSQLDRWNHGLPPVPAPEIGFHRDMPRGGNEAGREAGVRACMRANFDSDKQACIREVNAAPFLDRAAAEACGRMSFGSSIASCINAIAGKSFVPAEIELCGGNAFDSGKIDCFRSAGRVYEQRPRWDRRPDLDSYILRSLKQVRWDLESGNIVRALAGLADLISLVEEGSR